MFKLLTIIAVTTASLFGAELDTISGFKFEFGSITDTTLNIPFKIFSMKAETVSLSSTIGELKKNEYINSDGKMSYFYDTLVVNKQKVGTGFNNLKISGSNLTNDITKQLFVPPLCSYVGGKKLLDNDDAQSSLQTGGEIWISTKADAVQNDSGTVYKIDSKDLTVTNYFDIMNNKISAVDSFPTTWDIHDLFTDNKGNVFLNVNIPNGGGGDDVYEAVRFSLDSITLIPDGNIGKPDNGTNSYAVDESGNIYFFRDVDSVVGLSVVENKHLFMVASSTIKAIDMGDSTTYSGYLDFFKTTTAFDPENYLTFDDNGYLWAGTDKSGLYKLDIANKTVERDSSILNSTIFSDAPSESIWDIRFNDNKKWIEREQGVAFYDGTNWNNLSDLYDSSWGIKPLDSYNFEDIIKSTDSTILIWMTTC